jgi:hypothetical protein
LSKLYLVGCSIHLDVLNDSLKNFLQCKVQK